MSTLFDTYVRIGIEKGGEIHMENTKVALKVIFIIVGFILFLSASYGYSKTVHVVTTLNFLRDITYQIGEDKVVVKSILKGTENPHTYEAKPKDILALSKADIFIEIGGGLEGFADKLLNNVKKAGLLKVVLIEGIPLIEKNPHIWLDPENGKVIAEKIKKALLEKDPEDGEFFEKNLDTYLKKIDEAEKAVFKKLSAIKDKRVVSSLPTFIYFYKRFGFKEEARIVELPGHEPSLKRIRDIILLIKKKHIPFLTTNPFIPVKPVNIVKEETGIKEIPLVPLLYKPFNIKTYLDMIRYNGEVFLKR